MYQYAHSNDVHFSSSTAGSLQLSSPIAHANSFNLESDYLRHNFNLRSSANHLIFVDSAIASDKNFVIPSTSEVEVIILDANQDGLTQITETLSQRHDIASLQIFSHGNAGGFQLGHNYYDSSVLTQRSEEVASWSKALSEAADILLYGCDIAASMAGIQFVNYLSQMTGADVAASIDLTGNAALGGDWDLEYSTGAIAAALASPAAWFNAYEGVLTTINYTNFSSTGGLQLNGSAAQAGSTLRLTPAATNRAGSAFFNTPIAVDATTSFQSQFQFQLSGGTGGADGFAFVIQNSVEGARALGDAGSMLGYGVAQTIATTRMRQSLAIEFDTFRSIWDTNDNHISVLRDGHAGLALATTNIGVPDLNSGSLLNAWIDYNGNTDRLEVYVSPSPTRPTTATLAHTIDLASVVGAQAFVGFSASTGGRFNAHNINSWAFASNTTAPSSIVSLESSATIFVDESAGTVTLTATRTGNPQERVTLEYTTNEVSDLGGAQAETDYSSPTFEGRENTGQLVFEVGETTKTFTIPIINDTNVEGNETFSIGLQNPSTGTLGTPRTVLITIIDDDEPDTIAMSEATLTVTEGTPTAVITVQRSGNNAGTVSVNFATSNDTAIASTDYGETSGTIVFEPGQTTRTIAIPILNDLQVENNETFFVTLSDPVNAILNSQTTSTVTILDNDSALGTLIRRTAVSGLAQPTTIDWTPDGRYMLVAQKNGIVRVVDNGSLRATPLVDLSAQVNGTRDRGLLGFAVHPEFATHPYVYLLYTYDPPETVGRTGLAGPDGSGNRPSRLVRLTVNPVTMTADPASLLVLAGSNSTWAYTSRPDGNSTGDRNIPPSGIVSGTTITAPPTQINVGNQDNDPDRPGTQNQNIQDYLATDSESHSIGSIHFGPDQLLYLSNGDGTSYNFRDARTVRVQDINNLSGKVLRINPIDGQGVPGNPFFDLNNPNSNQSKVFYYGLRNPFRFTFDPVTNLPIVGDVGWTAWEEINTGPPGSNFGWPYLEGPNRTGGYQTLPQAIAFYNNGNRNRLSDVPAVFPVLARSHGAPDNANAIMVGDFYNSNTLMFGDINGGTLYAATFDANRQVSSVRVFDSGISYIVDLEMGPDDRLYGVNLVSGTILRWDPA